jgi:hypothetical protein
LGRYRVGACAAAHNCRVGRLPYSAYPIGQLRHALPAPPGTPLGLQAPPTYSQEAWSCAWQRYESACVARERFGWPQSTFRIPHTKSRGGNRPPAQDPPGARATSQRCRWVYEGGRKKGKMGRRKCNRCNCYSAPGALQMGAVNGAAVAVTGRCNWRCGPLQMGAAVAVNGAAVPWRAGCSACPGTPALDPVP